VDNYCVLQPIGWQNSHICDQLSNLQEIHFPKDLLFILSCLLTLLLAFEMLENEDEQQESMSAKQ